MLPIQSKSRNSSMFLWIGWEKIKMKRTSILACENPVITLGIQQISFGPCENYNQVAIPRINRLAVQLSELIYAPKTRTLRFVIKFMQNFLTKHVDKVISRLKEE